MDNKTPTQCLRFWYSAKRVRVILSRRQARFRNGLEERRPRLSFFVVVYSVAVFFRRNRRKVEINENPFFRRVSIYLFIFIRNRTVDYYIVS